MANDLMRFEKLIHQLFTKGWVGLSAVEFSTPETVIRSLGKIIPRRDGSCYKDLVPYTSENSPPDSMSSIIGLGQQPRHTDAAYLPLPPKYLVLYCLEKGEGYCPTLLWPLKSARLKLDPPRVLTDSTWVVHGGGRSPSYCTALEQQGNSYRVRFDPLCMHPISGSIWTVADVEHTLDDYTEKTEFGWEQGALLIVDNWSCLHARASGAADAPSRKLRRWSIGEDCGLGIRDPIQ